MKGEYLILTEFDDMSDLYFFEQELRDNEINCNIIYDKTNPQIRKVKVKSTEFGEAKLILKKLGYKKSNRTKTLIEDNDESYIEGVIEWNDKQYDPGYYTGGRTPHFYTNPGNSSRLGCLLTIVGFPAFILSFFAWFTNFRNTNFIELAGITLISLLVVIGGARMYLKKKK